MGLTILTPPAVEPLTVEEAKVHCAVDGDVTVFDDQFEEVWIPAAREQAEYRTGRALITQSARYTIDCFPSVNRGVVKLPLSPLQSVESIKYVDPDGVLQTLATSEYQVVNDELIGFVLPAYSKSWPSTRDEPGAIRIEFTAGYGVAASDVPQGIRSWMSMAIATWFKQRESVITGTIVATLPDDFCAGLLDRDRVNFL